MRLLVFGSRGFPVEYRPNLWQLLNRVHAEHSYDQEFVIISGHSVVWNNETKEYEPVGPDWWAEEWANAWRIDTFIRSIEDIGGWKAWPGKSAGHHRNRILLEEGKPDYALGLWDGKSPGSRDMYDQLVKVKPRIRKRLITPETLDWKVRWG